MLYVSKCENVHLNSCTAMHRAAQGIAVSLAMITKALGGNYVNFGVFKLYKDTALDAALDMALKMALSMPLSDVLAFPKVALAYFQVRSRPLPLQPLPATSHLVYPPLLTCCSAQFVEILFRNHISVFHELGIVPQSGVFVQLATAVKELSSATAIAAADEDAMRVASLSGVSPARSAAVASAPASSSSCVA